MGLLGHPQSSALLLTLGTGRRSNPFLHTLPLPFFWLSPCPTYRKSNPTFPLQVPHSCLYLLQAEQHGPCLQCENKPQTTIMPLHRHLKACWSYILNTECFGKLLCCHRKRCSSTCCICGLGCISGKQLLLPQDTFNSPGICLPDWALESFGEDFS